MSLLIANQRLPWSRYWVPWDGKVNSGWDGTGFITDPEGSWGRIFNPDLRTTAEVIDRPFVVLSGLPGMGKTQVVSQLRDDWDNLHPDESLIHVEGRTLDNTTAVYPGGLCPSDGRNGHHQSDNEPDDVLAFGVMTMAHKPRADITFRSQLKQGENSSQKAA